MNRQDRWIGEVVNYVCPFVPWRKWFDRSQDARVWVRAYRAYHVPAEIVSQKQQFVADFEQVRAVFLRWDAPYQIVEPNLFQQKNGQIAAQPRPRLDRTGEGVLLLLMTPLPENYDGNDENAAREKVSFTRSVMVAFMGRNAAYKYMFDVTVECGARTVGHTSLVFSTPRDETPVVNKQGEELVSEVLEKLSSLDNSTQNRIRLALRWYQRSFGDDRLVRDTVEGQIDDFINSWLALETLVMEGTTNIAPVKRMLGEIHGLDAQRVVDLFPIGRIYGLRGDILHEGQIHGLKDGLTRFMTDVFADLLLHVLDLPSGENTRRYLDGSANGLV
ncbi:MAG: hypothetical protein H0T57_09835 [Rubrobacter sp.]|nr:hypothetical protein [Rubrobacter sp.]